MQDFFLKSFEYFFINFYYYIFLGKYAGSPRHKFLPWQTSLLCILVEVAGVGSLVLAIAVAVAGGFIGFSATIHTHLDSLLYAGLSLYCR